jgi:spore germination cell wall hydrolase CwlJ-like protein
MLAPLTSWQFYEVTLLALTIWREARGEPLDAKIAVAHTVKNRIAHPGWWGNDYISVLTKKWQYSSLTDPNDKQLTTWPKADDHVFEECLSIAEMVVRGAYNSPLKGIDSYHDISIPAPKWAKEEFFVGQIGRLRFFNTDHDVEKDAIQDDAKPSS